MALPSSPPITMQQIYAEFLVPHGTSFKQLYRGGPYVPNTAQNAAISTDPNSLQMSQFYGAVRYVPLTASASNGGNASGNVFIPEPAPATTPVTTAPPTTITPANGTGSYTCTWFHASGDSSISTPGANQFSGLVFGSQVVKNTTETAVKICRVADGVMTVDVPVSVDLNYYSDL